MVAARAPEKDFQENNLMDITNKKQCTAKSKQSGNRCKNRPSIGKKVCHIHGGKNPGPPKGNQNANTHGIYSSLMSDADKAIFAASQEALDSLDHTIGNNAVLYARSLKHIASGNDGAEETGIKLAGEAIGRERKLKMSRHDLKAAQDSEKVMPLQWVDD